MRLILQPRLRTFIFKYAILLISITALHSKSWGQCNITVTPGSTTIVSPATIYDPGGTANYGNNLNVTTTYTAPAGYRLVLNFTSFNTESGYDFMWLYDAANASGTEKLKVSGTSLPSPASHTSTGQSFTIKFTSDGSVVASGFVATLTCLATCSNTTGGGTVSGDQTQCTSYDPTLINSTAAATGGSGGTTYQWESSLNNSTWTDISGATALTYDPATISQTTYYRRKSKSSSCSVWGAISNTITKTVSAAPTANAGVDITNCELANFNLTGNTPGGSQTGAWSVVSGTAYTYNATDQPNINYTVAAGTSATLRWTVTSGTCSASDDVVITNSNTSCNTSCTNPLNMNGDLENEGMATSFPLSFQGTPATLIDGNNNPLGWAQRYGTNPTNTTTFQGAFYLKKTGTEGNPRSGTHMIYLKGSGFCLSPLVTSGKIACGKTYQLTIWAAAYTNSSTQTYAPFALESYFGGGSSASQNTLAEFIAPASSSWNNLNWQRYSVTITIPNNGYNYGDFYFTANDNTSGIVIDDVCIREVDGGSYSNAGSDIFNCSNNFTLSANSPLSGYTGSWSVVSGSATITSPSSPTSTATISSGTSAILRWSVTNGSCTTTDDVTIGYSNTQGVSVNSPTICSGSSGTLIASDCSGSLLWSTGATTSTITVNPASSTTYTVTCTPSLTNLVLNPGFESATNFQYWSNWANAAVTTTPANIRTGTKAAEINAATAWGGFAQDIAVTPGQKITITWWAKTNNINVGSELGYKFLNSSYAELTTFEVSRIMSLTYTQYTVTAVVPPNAAYVEIYAGASSPSIVHVDDISITSTTICNSFATSNVTVMNCEICNNNIDDDGDGIIDCADDDCGYITNKDFDNGTANWNLYVQSGNAATFTVDNTSQLVGVSAAKVNVTTTASATEWHVQLAQTGKSIIAGKTYKISFSAKASSARAVSVAAQLGISPYTSYGYQNFNITTTAATYSFTFTASTSVTNNITLLFNLASTVGTVWIDNVVFRENCLYEICNNGIDDDGDGLIDALDTECNSCAFVGQNLVANGEFDAGNTGFTSDYIFTPVGSMCGNFGIYSVSNRISKVGAPNGCNLSIWAVADRANTGGNFMLIDPSAATGVNDRIWAQSVTVCPNTDYVFSVWTKNMYYSEAGGYSGVDPNFRFAINGTPLPNANFIMPRQARADSLQWIKVQGYWNSGSSTTANLTISNMIPGNYGNDLAIDGLYFGLCGKTVAITATTTNFCDGSSTTLSATSQTTSSGWLFYEWLKDGVVVASGANATTYNATAAGTYKLRTYYTTANNTGCPQESNSIVLTTISKPTVSITGASSICVGATTTLSPTSGGTWTSSNTAVATVTNAGVVTAIAAGTATFTFTQTSNGCISNPTGSVTINAIPTATITGSNLICIGSTTTLSPTTGGTWVSSNTAVATVTNAGVVTAVSVGTATFRFTNSTTGCQSSPSATVTINAKPTVSISGSATICVGATTTLSPTTGGTWTSNNTSIATVTNAGVVTGVAAGSTTFTFTQTSNGCISDPTASITVNARPTTNITGANTSLCIGNTTTISPTTGGTWTSSNTGIATISNAGVITAVSSGSATFTYTLTSTGCTSSATSPFTVNVKPSVSITGTSTICAGSTTTLSPTTGGTWTSNNTSVATVTNAGVVTGVAAGTATFTFTQTSTGCPSDATSTVTVNAKPIVSITGSASLCIGATTTLSPTTGGTWTSNNTSIATVTNAGVVTGVAAGTATFTFTQTSTGCISDATSTVTVNARPTTNITGANTSLCIGNTTTISPATGGTWTSSNTGIATITNAGVITAVSSGSATFTYTLTSTGCTSSATSPFTVNVKPSVSITGTSTICAGSTTTLSPTTGGTWTSNNTSVATVTNAGVVTGVAAGTATFTFTQTSTGCPSDATSTVTVNARPIPVITGSSILCIGSTTTLTPNTGGTWTSSNTAVATISNAGLVTAIGGGTANFTFTNTSTGCVSNASGSVTVSPSMSASINYNGSVCLTNSSVLTAVPTGGTSPFTYNWTGPSSYTATTQNASITLNGNYALTITDTYGCQASTTGFVYAKYDPLIVNLSTTVCEGQSVTLNLNAPNAVSYQWSSNASSATTASVTVVPVFPSSTYNVTVTNDQGCVGTNTAIINVTARPTVSITGSATICQEQTTQLSPTTGGTWASNDNTIATVNNAGLVTGINAGSTTFAFTQTSTGCVSNPTSAITVLAKPTVAFAGPNAICKLSTTQLTPNSGGTWTSSNTAVATVTNSGLVTGVGAGTATFTFTSSNGCASNATGTLTVDDKIGTTITGSNNLCLGQNTTIVPSNGGGTWSSSNTAIATINSSGVVTGVSAGIATVYYNTTSGACQNEATHSITINPKPTATITGANIICGQSTTQLSPSTGGTWTSSNAAIATVSNAGLVTGIAAGTVTFTFTNSQGCASDPTASVTVQSKPTVSYVGSNTICINSNTQLNPSSGGTWTSSNTSVATINNSGTVVGIAAGTATFTFTSSNGCVSDASSTLTVTTKPSLTIDYNGSICLTNDSKLTALVSGGTTPYSYNWAGPSSFTGNTQQVNITVNGNYSVTVSDINGCSVNASGFVYEKFEPFVVSLQTKVCEGTSVTLNATTSSAVSYLWSSNAGSAITSSVNVVPLVPASTYTVTITNTLGCSASVSASITVDPKPIVNITGGATICQGATTTLSPTTGGTWVSNNPSVASVTNSGVVTALATGTATFVFTNSTTNCASDDSPIVTISDKPVISFNGPTDICINGSTNLLPSSGGTWTSNNTSVATINNSGVVTGVASGTVTFTYLSNSSNCVAVTSGPLTVQNRPTVSISGDDIICSGLTTTLSPSSGGTWVSNNPSIASVTNGGVVTGLAAGTATFTFTNFSGCVSNATNPITINGKPSISFTGPTSGCIGSTSSMSPSSNGIWTSSNTSVATINNSGIITAVSSGTATFTFTSGITACISDASNPYTVIARPVVSIVGTSSLCIGNTTLLNPSTDGTWTSNNTAVATVTNGGVVTAIAEGTATFYFTSSSTGCVSNNTNPVLVYAKPVVSITGANSICIGSTSTLSPSSGGAWTSSNTGIATVNSNGVVLGISQGSATFTFTETSSGCTSNPSLPITVGPRPAVSITGPTTLCINGASSLSPTTGGSWVSNNPSIATVNNAGVVTAVSQGSVTFTFTSDNGCSSNPTSSILINGKPTILFTGPNQICIGGTTTISPSSGGSWVSNHPSIATINNSGVITGISNGQATFNYTDLSTGCVSDASASLTVNELPLINNLGSSQICVGTTTQLAPTTGGIWMSNNPSIADVSNNGTVTGIADGSASFVYTNSVTGCSSNQILTITVNPKPVINIVGASSICIGSTTTMNPSTGGTWTSKNPSIASINNSGVVTGLAQGIARFTYTNNTTGCISNNSAPILVNGHPSTSITGPNQICLGSTSQLSPSVGGTWVSEQPAIATVTNTGLVTGISAGTASFIFTETASGCSSPQGQNLITVTSSTPPTIVGASTICLKYQTQLAAPVNGVVWSSSNNKIATISNDGIVTGHAPGKVSFSYMIVATGCVGSLPADAITVVNCIDPDFNVGISNLTINGNVSTNDEVPTGTNWGQAMLISKPQGSTATITINADGTYTFIGNTKGQYIYNIPVCVPPMIYGCPSSQLIITVLDPLDTGNKNIANLDLATVYTGDSIWMNAMANDKCLNSNNCTLEGNSMEQTNTNLNGSSYLGLTGGFVYKPNNNAMGLDTIIYKICVDGDLTNCNQSRQYIVINAPNALNSTVAADDFLSTYAETSVTGDLTANDSDPENDAQSIVAQGSASAKISIPEGAYYIENNGVLHFEPIEGFVGTVDIIYTICDDNVSNQECVNATAHILVMGDMSLAIRVYLEGALMSNNGQTTPEGRPLMRDDLRNNSFDGKNYIPVKDPYKFGTEFVIINNNYEYVATGTMAKYDDPLDSLAVFSVTGRDAIVDWVFVELRSKSNNKTIVASRSGLLQRDGDIVDVDGVSTLKFAQVSLDSFYVVVRHRNHLGVMSGLVANGQLVDFTLPSTQVFDFGTTLNNGMDYTGLAMNPLVKNGYMALWAGDFDANRKLKFTNPSDDQNTLFFDVFAHEDNISGNANYNNAIGYYQGDYNMNGKSKYDNPNDDKNLLFSQILLYPLNTQYLSNFDFFIEQIPK